VLHSLSWRRFLPASAIARAAQCAPANQAAVDAQFQRFGDSWHTGDARKVGALFTPDAVLLATVSNTPRTTPAQVRDYFEHFLLSRPVARIDSSTTRIDCNMAMRAGTWTITLTDPKTHKKSDVRARYTFVYKFEHGGWWIEHLHSSMMPESAASGH
jgi:uncharacterized protein (TIGR02246 family)